MALWDFFHHLLGVGKSDRMMPRIGSDGADGGDELTRHLARGRIARVVIDTWDTGPYPHHLCWLLLDADDNIVFVVPTGDVLSERVIEEVADRRGFDRAAMRAALRSRGNGRFTVWRRPPLHDPPSRAG